MANLKLLKGAIAPLSSRAGASWLFRPVAALALVALSGCSSTKQIVLDHGQWFQWHPIWSQAIAQELAFDFEVVPGANGQYRLQGKTELPEGSELAIAALRYLKLEPNRTVNPAADLAVDPAIDPAVVQTEAQTEAQTGTQTEAPTTDEPEPALAEAALTKDFLNDEPSPPSQASNRTEPAKTFLALQPSYAILDYQKTTVAQDGTWQIQLNLWDVAKDGRYQESWQLQQKELDITWEPDPEVLFLATLIVDGAADQLQPLQTALADRQQALNATLLQTSLEGEQYFQLAKLLPIKLPTTQTQPPPERIQDINGGWGRRYLLVEQDPLPGKLEFPTERNSNAPGSPKEFIQ